MQFDPAHVWAEMSGLARIIAASLMLMGIASLGVAVERVWAFSRSARASRSFVAEIGPRLKAWDLEGVRDAAEAHQTSALARMFGAICRRYLTAKDDAEGKLTPVTLARNESERIQEVIGADLRRGLSVLASVGSTAPFVGLLGTVVGIIGAFQGIADKGSGGLGAVSAGIAEALYETAFGLMVAIPAVLLFNYLTGRINRIELTLAKSAGELLDDMENHDDVHEAPATSGRRAA
ncbi:MAG: MotA/TolQ/ExbB proton channel family protein [Myxococcota bacterium]